MSSRLGIIVRADEGGLGSQTWEYARHLGPHALLVLSVPPPRGEEHPERYDGLAPVGLSAVFPGPPEAAWRDFAEECDVILTAETCYEREFPAICRSAGARLVVHANPELWEWGSDAPMEAWAPTRWLFERLPSGSPVVPVPVDRERCARREIGEVRRLLHISAPAMHDRNGSQILKAAIPLCRSRFELLVAGPEAPEEVTRVGGVTVAPRAPVRDYWRLYDDADALVLPRRYGGLCLPMHEAASCGLPVVSIDAPPQRHWLARGLCVPTDGRERGMMTKGGVVPTWRCSPEALAGHLDALVAGETLDEGQEASEALAATLDWREWAPIYRELLGCS